MFSTGLELRKEVARRAYEGRWPIEDIDTTSLGTTTTLVISDLAFGSSGATANDYAGVWIYIASSETGGPAAGEISRVLAKDGFDPSTGTLTVAPAFSAAVQASTDLIFYYSEHPSVHWNAINSALRAIPYRVYLPVTLVTDGDMEDGSTTYWSSIGTPTSTQKVVAGYPFTVGRVALYVVTDAADEGVESTAVPVGDSEDFYLSVFLKVSSGSVKVTAYDSTNGAAIESATVSEQAPVEVRFPFTAPSGCRSVTVRIQSSGGAATWYTGPVVLWSTWRSRYPLPNLTRRSEVWDVVALENTYASSDDVYLAESGKLQPISYRLEAQERTATPIVLQKNSLSSYPVFYATFRRWAELTSDSASTGADKELVVLGALYHVERARAQNFMLNSQERQYREARAAFYAQRFAERLEQLGLPLMLVQELSPELTLVV